ncbi:MAG: F0F1 ATP synthase subunit gamma [Candidatus Margulisbacteria bacterium]|nr:F0F1 ATP synthase subunit gamma [Candidatus Margulisiibacteriota bacterium]
MSLPRLRNRLQTIKGLNSIFSALQVVTMVRTQKIKDKFSAMNRYLAPMKDVLAGRIGRSESGKKVLVVITSNRGLCGGFNHQAVRVAVEFAKREPKVDLVVLGRRGAEQLRREGQRVLFTDQSVVEKPGFEHTAAFFDKLYSLGADIYIAFNSYRSTLIQNPKIYRLSPLPEEFDQAAQARDFIIEPDKEELLEKLYYHYLETRFYQLVLESQMGELGARFMVLKGAVDTSKEMVTGLRLAINKARQASITGELLEIVSAAEAIRSDDE